MWACSVTACEIYSLNFLLQSVALTTNTQPTTLCSVVIQVNLR